MTQTLLVIFDFRAAIANCYRALKPGGVLLATFPGISQISRYDMDRWGDYWRFTDLSARRLFEEVFPASGPDGQPRVECAFHFLARDRQAGARPARHLFRPRARQQQRARFHQQPAVGSGHRGGAGKPHKAEARL